MEKVQNVNEFRRHKLSSQPYTKMLRLPRKLRCQSADQDVSWLYRPQAFILYFIISSRLIRPGVRSIQSLYSLLCTFFLTNKLNRQELTKT